MKLYCLVENQKNAEGHTFKQIIKGPVELPVNTEHVSNLNIMSDGVLKEFGWLPYEKKTDNKEIFVSSKYEILEDRVIEFLETRDKTADEKALDKKTSDQQLWCELRYKRDQLLNASDKLVVADKWENMQQEEKDKITIYRQALRNLPENVTDPAIVTFPVL